MSLFVYQHGTIAAYLLLYMDDIILTSSSLRPSSDGSFRLTIKNSP
jgi:hypothetical protein